MARSIMWFRRDLRLADHPALLAAAARGDVVPLFVVDPNLVATAGAVRLNYLVACLRSLDLSIDLALVVRHGDPAAMVAGLAEEVSADKVFVTSDFGPYGTRRDAAVSMALAANRRELVAVGSPYAVDPGVVTSGQGTPYRVFTPFLRAWRSHGWPAPFEAPIVRWYGAPDVPCDEYPTVLALHPHLASSVLATAGERSAHAVWGHFATEALDAYSDRRELPAVAGTSRLSAALHFGTLHPRQLLCELGDAPGHGAFRGELAWREFYADVLHHTPKSAWEPLQPKTGAIVVDTDAGAHERFAAWRTGMTGYPIVDAGMRQLLSEGWMHNRVRMIVASFLVKDLHLPWQWGARHFMNYLVDGDLASNNHGWQWAAGTGTDAAPYFRIFNPTSQSERFDASGEYIRRYVPELESFSGRAIHDPCRHGSGVPFGYVLPIVDHGVERVEALRRYGEALDSAL